MADNISFISTKSGQHSKQKRLRAHVDYDEMTVKYGRISLGVPIGFKACLENVTREVLREQPKDIPAFLACYFNQLNENQKKGISANNLVTERIVEVKAFEEQGVQKEEEKVETQEAGNVTDDCQVSNVQSQTEMPAPVPTADDNQLSFEQQQEIEHEGDENQQENEEEQEINEVNQEVKAVCLEDILKQEEYKHNENAMSLEEQEKIDHQEETTAAVEEEETSELPAESEAEQIEAPKPVCLEQLLKEKEQSQIIEENTNPKKIESAPSTNQNAEPKTESNESQAKATQSEPAVLNNSASEVPSHISLDALPDNIKLVEAIVKTSVTELAEEENAEEQEEVQEEQEEQNQEEQNPEEQNQEEQEQKQEEQESVENTTEQKIEPTAEEAVDDKNGDIEA